MGTEISFISYEEISAFWRAHLWPDRPESIRPVSSMLFDGGFDPGIRARYTAAYFGFFVDGELVGVNSGHFTSEHEFRARGLCVLPEYRGRGIARALLRATIQHGKERGAALVWSYPRDAAWKVYEAVGFKATDRKLKESDANRFASLR